MADTLSTPTLSLSEALVRLPLEAPERSAWPMLAQRLQARQRRPRWPFAAAAAAALLALAFVPRQPTVAPLAITTTGTTTTASRLSALMDESARLERLLGAVRDDGASSASAASMSIALEDRLSSLDAELQSERAPARQRDLWQQRIVLLREAASLEASRHYLAAHGQGFDVALVSAY
jgi:hypothetical protein